jgi:dihydrofolate reductase
MGKLTSFTFITLNGYFEGPQPGDISWHKHDSEEAAYAVAMLQARNTLLFGRVTYEQMAGYWPTPVALEHNGDLAKGMNDAAKIVFSGTLEKAAWNNTTLIRDNMVSEISRRKAEGKENMTLLGSGSILTQLAEEDLIDEYQFMIDPVAIGAGGGLFKGLQRQLDLTLRHSQVFSSGVILACYSR